MEAKKAKAILLRHRYDNLEQLRRHLHVVDGATLIFFRDPKLSVTAEAVRGSVGLGVICCDGKRHGKGERPQMEARQRR